MNVGSISTNRANLMNDFNRRFWLHRWRYKWSTTSAVSVAGSNWLQPRQKQCSMGIYDEGFDVWKGVFLDMKPPPQEPLYTNKFSPARTCRPFGLNLCAPCGADPLCFRAEEEKNSSETPFAWYSITGKVVLLVIPWKIRSPTRVRTHCNGE